MRDLSNDLRWLAVNSATIKSWPLERQIEGCARAGITGIAPWRDGVAALGVKRSRELLRAHAMAATCYCRGGMFTAADAAGLLRDPEDATTRMRAVLATRGIH